MMEIWCSHTQSHTHRDSRLENAFNIIVCNIRLQRHKRELNLSLSSSSSHLPSTATNIIISANTIDDVVAVAFVFKFSSHVLLCIPTIHYYAALPVTTRAKYSRWHLVLLRMQFKWNRNVNTSHTLYDVRAECIEKNVIHNRIIPHIHKCCLSGCLLSIQTWAWAHISSL